MVFGMEVVPARVEALRSKAKRLVARGRPTELAPGRFTLSAGAAGPGGGCASDGRRNPGLNGVPGTVIVHGPRSRPQDLRSGWETAAQRSGGQFSCHSSEGQSGKTALTHHQYTHSGRGL